VNGTPQDKGIKVKTFITIVTGLVLLLGTVQSFAETEVKIGGQVRFRSEVDGRSFDPAHATGQYNLLRTRVNLEAIVDSNTHAFVQFQDSRVLGGENQFGEFQSGTLNDGKNVDLHQAYVQMDRIWIDGLGARAGRFEFNLGNQRVFGAVGWSNVGRAWEGALGWYTRPDFTLTGVYLKVQEEEDPYRNRDFDIYGFHAELSRYNLELFGVYELNNDINTVSDISNNDLDRWTLGVYLRRNYQQWDLEINGAFQTGKIADSIDIQAFMTTGELGHTLPGSGQVRFALGADYTSGDSDPTDTKHKAYNNLYYTGHKFRGYMDYFVSSETRGLVDLMARGRGKLHSDWTVLADLHYFSTAQNYPDITESDTTATSNLGFELDLTVVTSSVKGVDLRSGFSVFLPDEAFVRMRLNDPAINEADPTFWGYLQATVNF
jgi:hypothetical protein